MKRYILSSALALMMFFTHSSDARAEEFCSLGSHSAGTELNCHIASVSSEASVQAEGLPEGLYIAETPGEDGKSLSLRGAAMAAGRIDFQVTVSEEPGLISCSADITAAVPSVSVSGDVSCAPGESVTLSVTASAADNGVLSCQWYYGERPDPATAIIAATDFVFSPDTASAGRFAYCCEVTNSNNGYESRAVSAPIYVTVAEPAITGIEVAVLPGKLSYAPGDKLDPTGLVLRVNYDNGSSKTIEGGFEASPAAFTEPGVQNVNLRYEGFSCFYQVDVSLSQAVIEGIGVLSLPVKTDYTVGDMLDTEGLSIRVYTANGQFDVEQGLKCSPEKLREAGRQTITVEYEGKRCSFTVNVEDDNELKSIDIASLPTRREYAVGDTLDTKGLSIQLIYGGRTEISSRGFTCSPTVLSSPGPQTITVSFEGHTASFSINVKEAPASPSPSHSPVPSVSPSVETPEASPSVAPNVQRDHQARELGGLVKIIFAAALLSLAGLAGYVVYMRKKGKR